MHFREGQVDEFKKIFNDTRPKILEFGCRHVELFGDLTEPNTLFTISRWDSQSDLDNYRNSALFEQVWKRTKVLFLNPANAWSLVSLN